MPILAVQRGLARVQCWVPRRFARVALDAAFPVPLLRSPLVLTTPFWVVTNGRLLNHHTSVAEKKVIAPSLSFRFGAGLST